MEGQSMMNMFDGSSGSFLDEVANPGGGAMMQPDGAHSMGLGGDAMMQGALDQGMNPGMQQDMMLMAQQQPTVQQSYTNIHNPMQQTQKLHHYNSYGPADQFAGGGATVGIPGQLLSSSHPSQQPFGSPPPGGAQLQSPPQQSYPQYTLQSSPRLTPPRQPTPQPQQMSISQSSMTWRASPGPPQQNMPPGSPYGHNGLSQQPNSSGPTYQMPTYLTHHDYALPPSMAPAGSQQRLALYQDSQAAMTNQQGSYSPAPPPIGSPAPTQRLTHMNVQTQNVISNQRPVVSGASSYAQNTTNELLQSPESVQSNYEAVSQVQQGLQPTHMNSGSEVNTQRLQDFTTYHQPSPNPGAAEAPPLSHYSQSDQSRQQHNQPYLTSVQQQNVQPSLTTQTSNSTGLISVGAVSQGNFQTFTKHNLGTNMAQTTLLSTAGGFQTDGRQVANSMSNANIAANQQSLTIPVGQQFRVVTGNAGGLSNATLIVNSSMAGLGSGAMATSNAGQQPVVLQQTSQQNVSLRIQQLQQQIQQLYNMQQTPQTQQKMLDMQEQVRTLAAQQQLQRQKQQFFQQRPQQATIRLQQPSGLQGQVVTAIRLQPSKVAQQTRMAVPQQSLEALQQKQQHHVTQVQQHQLPPKPQPQTIQLQQKQVVQLQQAQVVQVQPKQQTQLLQLQQAKQQTQVVQVQQPPVQVTPQQAPKTVQSRQVIQVQATPQQVQKSAPQTVRIVKANMQQKPQQPQQMKQISILSTPQNIPVTVSKAEQRPPVSTHVLVSLPQLITSTASQQQLQSQSQSRPQLQPSVSVQQQTRTQALPQLQPAVSVQQQARSQQPLAQLQPTVSVQQPQLKSAQPQLVTLRTLQPAQPGQTQQSQQIQQIIIIQQPNQQQQQVRIANAQVQGDQIQTLGPVVSAATTVTTTTAADGSSRKEKRKGKSAQLQDKANKIIAEAIAKAEAEGREVPKVLPGASPPPGGSVEGDADDKPKKKKVPTATLR